MNIAILIPVIRPEKAKELKAHLTEVIGQTKYQIFMEEDNENKGCPKMVNHLMAKAKGTGQFDAFCFLGDDTVPLPGFLEAAVETMGRVKGGWGVVGLNDVNNENSNRSTHFLLHAKAVKSFLNGVFFSESYNHCFCDDELIASAMVEGRYLYAPEAKLVHNHPGLIDDNPGSALNRIRNCDNEKMRDAYSAENYNKDKLTFRRRVRQIYKRQYGGSKVKVGVCIPCTDYVHADFAFCLAQMYAACFPNHINPIIISHKGPVIAFSRQALVDSALDIGCEYMLFLDSDMVFPPQTLIRLLSHDKGYVCADASKKREPFGSVVKGMKGEALDHTGTEEGLVQITGVSPAVALVKASVFDQLEMPYFNTPYTNDRFESEDRHLGRRIQEQGVECYCDMGLSKHIGHIGCKTYFLR